MAKQIMLDSNILGSLSGTRLSAERSALLAAIKSGAYILNLADVNLVELLTGRKEKFIKDSCVLLGEIFNGHLYKSLPGLVDNEINQKKGDAFVESAQEIKIREVINDIAKERASAAIQQVLRKVASDIHLYCADFQSGEEGNLLGIVGLIKQTFSAAARRKQYTDFVSKGFDHYYGQKEPGRLQSMERFLTTNKIPYSSADLKNYLNITDYPALNIWTRLKFAFHYYCVHKKWVYLRKNDILDLHFLVYASYAENLISEDKLMGNIGEIVYLGAKKVLKLSEV